LFAPNAVCVVVAAAAAAAVVVIASSVSLPTSQSTSALSWTLFGFIVVVASCSALCLLPLALPLVPRPRRCHFQF